MKIWGTVKSASSTDTIKALAKLPTSPSTSLVAKRESITACNNHKHVTKWWFVIRGEDRLLEHLQNEWQLEAVQTAWKLKPVLCYKDPAQSQPVKEATLPTAPLTTVATPKAEKPEEPISVSEETHVTPRNGPEGNNGEPASTCLSTPNN